MAERVLRIVARVPMRRPFRAMGNLLPVVALLLCSGCAHVTYSLNPGTPGREEYEASANDCGVAVGYAIAQMPRGSLPGTVELNDKGPGLRALGMVLLAASPILFAVAQDGDDDQKAIILAAVPAVAGLIASGVGSLGPSCSAVVTEAPPRAR